jgi:hypothetical protein
MTTTTVSGPEGSQPAGITFCPTVPLPGRPAHRVGATLVAPRPGTCQSDRLLPRRAGMNNARACDGHRYRAAATSGGNARRLDQPRPGERPCHHTSARSEGTDHGRPPAVPRGVRAPVDGRPRPPVATGRAPCRGASAWPAGTAGPSSWRRVR